MWGLLIIVGLFALPLLFGFLRDAYGGNTNKFHGDELNKQRRSSVRKRYDSADNKKEEVRRRAEGHYGQNGFNGPS